MRRESLKSKDIATPNHFETEIIRFEQYSSLQLCLENEESKKGNTNISVGNNSNCCTIPKDKAILCLPEMLTVLLYPNQIELLNKISELVSKFRHENRSLLQTFNSNDCNDRRKYLYSLMSSNQLK